MMQNNPTTIRFLLQTRSIPFFGQSNLSLSDFRTFTGFEPTGHEFEIIDQDRFFWKMGSVKMGSVI